MTCSAQSASDWLKLEIKAKQGTVAYAVGAERNSPDSISRAISLLEPYVQALHSSPAGMHKLDMDWQVLRGLSKSYGLLNDTRIEGLVPFIRSYYATHGLGKKHQQDYYQAMEGLASYYLQHQQADSIASIATELLARLDSDNDSTLITSSCYLMLASSAFIRQDQKQGLRYLEQAYAKGKNVERLNRKEKSMYINYCNAVGQLAQGYLLSGYNQRALSLIEEMQEGVKEVFSAKSQQYLSILNMRCNILGRLNALAEMDPIIEEIDSLSRQTDDLNPQVRAMLQQTLDYYHTMVGSHATADAASQTSSEERTNVPSTASPKGTASPESSVYSRQADPLYQKVQSAIRNANKTEAIREMESVRNEIESHPAQYELSYYNAFLTLYAQCLLGWSEYSKLRELTTHARQHISQNYAIGGATAFRYLEMIDGRTAFAAKNMELAVQCFVRSKEMFEAAGDMNFNYIDVLSNLTDALQLNGRTAYAKLVLDETNRCLEGKMGHLQSNNTELQAAIAANASKYMYFGYASIAKEKMKALFNRFGSEHEGLAWDFARRSYAVLLCGDKKYAQAEELLQYSLDHGSSRAEKDVALRMLTVLGTYTNNSDEWARIYMYNKLMQGQCAQVLPSLSDMERENTWYAATTEMSYVNNTVLATFHNSQNKANASSSVCQSYNTAIYVKSRQERGIHATPDWEEVRSMLGDHEVAVEFIACQDTLQKYHYAALLLRKSAERPVYVKLCEAEELNSIWQDVIHTDTALINRVYSLQDTQLYQLLWKELEPQLQKGDTVYYSPVGFIGRLNFGVISNGHERMQDLYALHRLSSTADIKKFKQASTIQPGKATVYGGLDYNASHDELLAAAQPYAHAVPSTSEPLTAMRTNAKRSGTRGAVDMLTGTLEEAHTVSHLLHSAGYDTQTLTGANGNEESLKSLSGHAPHILHIATHGFFLSTNVDQQRHASIIETLGTSSPVMEQNMLYTGLLMAGADHTWNSGQYTDGLEDGIVTAFELSQIDLTGCQLVVLSACETGLGRLPDNNSNDFNIPYALKLANAGTIVASLWEVPDEATALLMKHFYKGIIKGIRPSETLKSAQDAVRKVYPDPYYWAAFYAIN